MTETLQGLYQNLESKVQEKTERLEAQRARLEALYESAAFVARAESLEALAQGIARQVRQVARADASAVRWSDEANRKYCCWRRTACRRRWSTKNCASPPATACAASPRRAP
jgi:two-component system nitrate/nitrite sensor histidine kinase NarX